MKISDLATKEFDEYSAYYINLIPDGHWLDVMRNQMKATILFFESIAAGRWTYSYGAGKWSLAEVFQHIIDTERIFSYRALRIARGDSFNLPGFDVDSFAGQASVQRREPQKMLTEYAALKNASVYLYESLSLAHLCRMGVASDAPISSRACAIKLIGHEIHHINIIKQRYLAS